MRARNIKPGLFKNEILGAADPLLTILFQGLWCLADREGRLEDRPLRIKAEVFPYREVDVNRELTVLERLGFIQRFEAPPNANSGQKLRVIQVLNFLRHQHPHHTEKKSELPAPVSSPLNNGETPSDSLIPDSLYIPRSKSRKRKPLKTTIPENFGISEEIRSWAREKGHTRLEEHFEFFVGYVRANGKSYADWDAAFRNAIRGNWAHLSPQKLKPEAPFNPVEKTLAQMEGR